MKPSTRHAYDAARDFSRKAFRSGCYAPFASLYFNPLGQVTACCKSQRYILGNMATERLDDVWKGAPIQAMREALKNYEFRSACEFCEWQIDSGRHLGAHTAVFEHLPVEDPAFTWPGQLEFALSNLCNYECIMCYGDLSSRIRANRDGLPPLPKVYGDQFFADLRKFLPHLYAAKWHGGEPFLTPENFRIWDMMIEDGVRPGIQLTVTTNASTYNAKVERVLGELPISFAISIDGITKATLETIRIGARHEQVMENVERFRQYAEQRGTSVAFAVCLMRQNWHEFGDILLYAEERKFPVYLNTVIEPEHCSLYTLPVDEQRTIIATLEAQSKDVLPRLKLNGHVWSDALQGLRGNAGKDTTEDVHWVRDAWHATGNLVDHIEAAWKLATDGRYRDAAEEALKVPPTDSRYYFALVASAHGRRRDGDHGAAEQLLEQAVTLANRRPEAFLERAWLRCDQRRFEEGIADAQHALEVKPPPQPHVEAAIHDALGFLYRALGRFEESSRAFDRLAEMKPHDAKVQVHRAWLFRQAGRHEEAAAAAEAALALDPQDEEAQRLKSEMAG